MKAADAFYGNNAAGLQNSTCPLDGGKPRFFAVDNADRGTAGIAAYGLGVIASRFGMRVFVMTVRAHRECAHTRALTVIRHGVEDCEPGAA